MKKFLATRGVRVAAVVLSALAALVLAAAIWGGGSPFRSALRIITSPVERLIEVGMSKLENVYAILYQFENIKAENARLRKELADVAGEIRAARSANAENERLRKLLSLQELKPDWELVGTAQIIAWDASSWSSKFTIGAGLNAGLQIGDTIITEEAFLVGQVTDVGATTATVRTIIDVDANVGALVDRTGVSGAACGDFRLMRRGVLKLAFLPKGANLLNGDMILSSGAGEVFPQGLEIGKITSYKIDDSGMDWYGEITPSANLDELTQIFVVR